LSVLSATRFFGGSFIVSMLRLPLIPRPLELLGKRRGALRRALDGGAHRGILQPLGRLTLPIRERPAGSGGGLQFEVREVERHVRIVAPPGAAVHAVWAVGPDWTGGLWPSLGPSGGGSEGRYATELRYKVKIGSCTCT